MRYGSIELPEHKMLNPDSFAQCLREELDLHSAFTWEKFLREGVDAHFNARKLYLNKESLATPSEYWNQDDYSYPFSGFFTCPSTIDTVATYSKRAFIYPVLSAWVTLPSLLGYSNGATIWFGMENGASGDIVGFRWSTTDGVTEAFEAAVGPFKGPWRTADITGLLPANAKTTRRRYTIELTKSMAVFWIDTSVLAYGLISPGSYIPPISGPPYSLFSSECPLPRTLTILIEVSGKGKELKLNLAPYHIRAGDGQSLQPRAIGIFSAGSNTLLSGMTLYSGSVTGQPIPVFTYAKKTFHFQASKAGSLLIEILTPTGNWRTYDSLPISSDTLVTYFMNGDSLLARITYTPTSYPATINEAEVILNGDI